MKPAPEQLDETIAALAAKAGEMLSAPGGLAPHELAALLASVASARLAVRSAAMSVFRVSTGDIEPSKASYAYDALAGAHVNLLVVNGAVIPRTQWAWSAQHGSLLLVGYTFPADATVELYYLN